MGSKIIYTCDICGEKITELKKLMGIKFSTLNKFTLGNYGCTEGKHICFGCARQFLTHLNNEIIKAELLSEERGSASN